MLHHHQPAMVACVHSPTTGAHTGTREASQTRESVRTQSLQSTQKPGHVSKQPRACRQHEIAHSYNKTLENSQSKTDGHCFLWSGPLHINKHALIFESLGYVPFTIYGYGRNHLVSNYVLQTEASGVSQCLALGGLLYGCIYCD